MIIKPIPGFSGYFASSCGKIFSNRKRVVIRDSMGKIAGAVAGTEKKLHELKPSMAGRYLSVALQTTKGEKTMHVHKLVLLAFQGEAPRARPVCRHLDGNRVNNRAINLAWGSHKQNSADMVRHGTRLYGDKVPTSKLSNKEALFLKYALSQKVPRKLLSKAFCIPKGTLANIACNTAWRWLKAPPALSRAEACEIIGNLIDKFNLTPKI